MDVSVCHGYEVSDIVISQAGCCSDFLIICLGTSSASPGSVTDPDLSHKKPLKCAVLDLKIWRAGIVLEYNSNEMQNSKDAQVQWFSALRSPFAEEEDWKILDLLHSVTSQLGKTVIQNCLSILRWLMKETFNATSEHSNANSSWTICFTFIKQAILFPKPMLQSSQLFFKTIFCSLEQKMVNLEKSFFRIFCFENRLFFKSKFEVLSLVFCSILNNNWEIGECFENFCIIYK